MIHIGSTHPGISGHGCDRYAQVDQWPVDSGGNGFVTEPAIESRICVLQSWQR